MAAGLRIATAAAAALAGLPLDHPNRPQYRALLKNALVAAAHLDRTHRFHDLRHTFGTRMAAAGVSMRTLQAWMGHRDIQTTQRYADYAPSAREAELIASAFGASRRTADPESEQDGYVPSRLPDAGH